MKRKPFITMLMMGAALVVGLASCEKNTDGGGNIDPEATGSLMVTLDFDKNVSTYAQSSAKPTTTWKDNITSLAVFFVETNGNIKAAQTIPFETNDNIGQQTKTINGVPKGTYDVYVFANWDQAVPNWTVNSATGRNIEQLYLAAYENPEYDTYKHVTAEATSKGYQEAPEIFVAKHENITVVEDTTTTDTTPYALTRIVSLVRVRINQHAQNDWNQNNFIDFKDENASLRIRRINTGINLMYTDATMSDTTERGDAGDAGLTADKFVFFSKGAFSDTDPQTGYSTGTIVDDDFTLWKDVILIPAGATASADQLDVMITGIVDSDGYVPAGYPKDEEQEDGSIIRVESAPIGSQIVWRGTVDYILNANGILELNLTLMNAGTWVDPEDPDKPTPEPDVTGNLAITVSLTDWGNIASVDMDM